MPTESLLAIVISVVYLGASVWWISRYFSRIEPYLLNRLGKRSGLKIIRYRRNWKILDDHTWQQGCSVMLWELLATIIFLIAPFWVLIGLIMIFVFLLSGNG